MSRNKGRRPISESNLTEVQHYVWRAYLKGWAVNNYLYYYRRQNGDVRRASPKKIAQISFFYAAEELTAADLQFLELLISGFKNPELRELARGWIFMLQLPFRAGPFLQSLNLPDNLKAQAARDMDFAKKMMTEQLHGKIETDAAPLLKCLRNKDLSFLGILESRSIFVIFLSNQYFRTQKMRLALPCNRSQVAGHNPVRTALVESLIFATNVGASIMAEWSKYKVFLLESDGSAPFITGDQPVINLLGEKGGPTGDAIELYYPLSPSLALLFTKEPKFPSAVAVIGKMLIETYNMMIWERSEQDVYCHDKAYLEGFIKDCQR